VGWEIYKPNKPKGGEMNTSTIVFMVIVEVVIWIGIWIGFMVLVYSFFKRTADYIKDKRTPFESVETPGARYVTGVTGPVTRYAIGPTGPGSGPVIGPTGPQGPTGPSFIKGMKCVACRTERVTTNGWINGVQAYFCYKCGCIWDSTYYIKEEK
jgi:hypothetical protein